MNIYDTANKLAAEIKKSEEYLNYKMAKQSINLNNDLKEKIKKFEIVRYEVQLTSMQTGKNDEQKMQEVQKLYAELIENDDAKRYFEAETKFNIILADINKIIGDSIRDVMQ